VVPLVLQGIVESSSLGNKEELVAALQQMNQPNPEQQQMQQQQMQQQMELMNAQIQQLMGQAAESNADAQEAQARAQKIMVEAQMIPQQMQVDLMKAITQNLKEEDKDAFERRVEIAKLLLKEREMTSNEKIVQNQMQTT
jgi:hypothetical protein